MSYLAKSRRSSNTVLRLLLAYLVLTGMLPVPAITAQDKATRRTHAARKAEQQATRPAGRATKERITPSALQANGKIAFASNRSAAQFDIFIMNADGSEQTNLTNHPAGDRAPSFSPNGSKIVFESDRDGNDEIYSMNADGTSQTRLTNDANFDYEPAFSPDGSKIVFTSERSGNAEIYAMNLDGSGVVNLTNHPNGDAEASFSPDGSQIVFVSTRDGGDGEVYLMNADGTNQTRLTTTGGSDPSFSPDGRKITYATASSGVGEAVALMNADGTNQIPLTANAASDKDPAFSPDGTKIVFESDRDGNLEIYSMNPDGSAQTRLTNDGAADAGAAWQTLLSCAPPPPNGVAWYRAEENADDSIGTNHGTLQNGTAIVGGFAGAAFEFDGVDDVVDIGQLTDLQNAQQLTLMAWVKKRDTSNTIAGIIGKWDGCTGCTDDTFLLYNSESVTVNKGGFVVRFTDDTAAAVAGTTDIPVGQWVHIAATWRSSDGEIKIYKNGRLDGSGTGGVGKTLKYQTNYTAKIGEWGEGHGGNPLYRFGGAIDEATIFNRALSQTEIRNVYDAKNDGLCLASAAQTITASNTNDSGPGSLRQAILDANASPGTQTIDFQIPGAGVHTINLASPLPDITDPVVIDGYTQPGSSANTLATGDNAVLLVELNGAGAGAGAHGLNVSAGGTTIKGLVINRFSGSGVNISGGSNNRIEGNFIGTDAAGASALANNRGVDVANSQNNTIGGTTPAARNLLSGNSQGVQLFAGATGTRVQGNYIGTTASGTAALANTLAGLLLNATSGNTVGGTEVGAGNLISGNASGIFITQSSSNNTVQGNLIGTAADGVSAVSNALRGIFITQGSNGNTIGGAGVGAGNTVAFNNGDGVIVDASVNNPVTGNSIHSNNALGLDLLPVGINANDAGDADSGANNLQNFPSLSSVTVANGNTTFNGTLASAPNTTYSLHFYSNAACDASGNGEGQTYLGTFNVTTDASGDAAFNSTINGLAVPSNRFVTATATDPAGNTSEFSACLQASAPPGTFTISGQIREGANGLGGVTVTLSGTQSATTTTDANGNYTLASVAAGGNYVVTPSRANYTFTPPSQSFNNLSADQTANFSATFNTYTLSGQVTAGGNGLGGVSVTLTRTGSPLNLTTTTDPNGNYSFTNVAAGGDYFVTPSHPNYTFTPPNRQFSNLNANGTANFTATLNTLTISGQVTENGGALPGVTITLSGTQSGTATTDANGNYSFNVSAGGNYTITPSLTHYTFNPPNLLFINQSSNATANFAATRNTHSLGGQIRDNNNAPLAAVNVTLSGGQSATTATDASGNYAFANLPAGANYTVTPALAGYAFAPPSAAFNNLSANGTANFTGTPGAHTIGGRISDAGNNSLANVTVTLSGAQSGTALTDAGGNYSFSVAAGASYTVAPTLANYTFAPPSATFNNIAANQTANFTGTLQTFGIGGRIADANNNAVAGASVALSGGQAATTTTDAAGHYSFAGLPAGANYIVTPALAGYTFAPPSATFNNLSANVTANFLASTMPTQPQPVNGRVLDKSDGSGIASVTLYVTDATTGAPLATTTTDANGNYTLMLPPGGDYTITTAKAGLTFQPAARTFGNLSGGQTSDFTATEGLSISGRVAGANGNGIGNVIVTLSGSVSRTTLTMPNGGFLFNNLPANGNYTVQADSGLLIFNPLQVIRPDLASDATLNLVAAPRPAPVPTPPLEEDFGGTTRDPLKFSEGTLTQAAGSKDPLVTVVQEGGVLKITPRAGINEASFNGYVTSRAIDFTDATASVEVNQTADDGAQTIFAVGRDERNFFRFIAQDVDAPLSTASGAGALTKRTTGLRRLIFQARSAGVLNGLPPSIPFDPVQHRFWRFRHSSVESAMFFETSPDRVVWTEQRRIALAGPIGLLATELSAGTSGLVTNPGQAIFDNLLVQPNAFVNRANNVRLTQSAYRVNENAGFLTLKATRAGDTSRETRLDYATEPHDGKPCNTQDGKARARCDFGTTAGTIRFAPGETEKTFDVFITDDIYAEGDETVRIALGFPSAGVVEEPASALVTIVDNDAGATPHPINTAPFLVRQQYLDFLNREPDANGFNAWVGILRGCAFEGHFGPGKSGSDPACDRITVSSSFFRSTEFQFKGFFVYRFYKATLGRVPTYEEFLRDMTSVTGQTEAEVVARREAFANAWVERADFVALNEGITNAEFVDQLATTAGVPIAGRAQLILDLNNGSKTRAQVLRVVVDSPELFNREYNAAFVLMQYFGYLQRDPDEAGYNGWLNLLNRTGDYRTMIFGFLYSQEYLLRFGQP